MSIKLAVIDMDETLLRKDKTYDQDRFDEIIKKFKEKELTLCIASGNAVREIKKYLSDFALENVYLAGDNGNDIEFAGEHIHTNFITKEALEEITAFVDGQENLQMVVNTPDNAYAKYIYEEDEEFISLFYQGIQMVDSYDEMPAEDDPIKTSILSHEPHEKNLEFVEYIVENIEGVSAVTSGEGWFDAFNEEGGKGPAVKWLQEEKGISPDETIAFGDGLNDSGMMEESKYSVVMGNSDEGLKEFAQYEIGTNEEQAVLDVLKEFLDTGDMDFMEQYEK